jgi:hypothetical protein
VESADKAKEDKNIKKELKDEDQKMEVEWQVDESEEVKMEQDTAEEDGSTEPQSAPVSVLSMAVSVCMKKVG